MFYVIILVAYHWTLNQHYISTLLEWPAGYSKSVKINYLDLRLLQSLPVTIIFFSIF